MRVSHFATLMTISLVALIPGTTDSAVTNAARPGVQKILFHGAEAARKLPAALVGQGVDGVASAAWTDSQGGRVTWSVIRDDTDHVGIRHIFYRQRYLPPSWIAEALEPAYAKDGIEVYGAEIGLHYWKTGDLEFVFGTQVPDLVVANDLAVTDRNQAYNMAQEEAAVQPDFHAADRATWSPDLVKGQIENAKLLLWNDGKTAEWRYAWQVPTLDASGEPFRVVMDAGTGQVLELVSVMMAHTCSPSNNTNQTAVGHPQNPAIPDRSLWATAATDRGGSFTHEAHRAATYGVPDIQVMHKVATTPCGDDQQNTNGRWELYPLETDGSGHIVYDGLSRPPSDPHNPYPGSVAGDALWFTYLTMQTLHTLGRNGWDGLGSPAVVTVDAYNPNQFYGDRAAFNPFLNQDYAPHNSVFIYPRIIRTYSLAAALDVVAHEWGHGVIFTSANFSPRGDNTVAGQLHEGFADVIGYITEFANQPEGSGYEKAEWKGAEDTFGNGHWDRRVDDPYKPTWANKPDSKRWYWFHKEDGKNPITDKTEREEEAHARGNMLPVALRLVAVGGQNPICGWNGWTQDCNISVNGLGMIKARSIFFRMLVWYCTSTTEWEDLADLGKMAAFGLYCNGVDPSASCFEQNAVNSAFGAIGYPGTPGCIQCPSW